MNFQKCHFLTFLTQTCVRYPYFLKFFKNILDIGVIARNYMCSLSLAFSCLNVITIASNRIFCNYICDYYAIGYAWMKLNVIACASNVKHVIVLLAHVIASNRTQSHLFAW